MRTPPTLTDRRLAAVKVALFVAALAPAALLVWDLAFDGLGPDPVEALQRRTGAWTFNFLLLTLAVTPLRSLTGLHWLLRLRRMLGLYAFFYGTLHFLAFIGFDHAFDVDAIARDVLKRPFTTVGFAAWAIMLPLALTSHQGAIRALGGRRWQALHRSVYAAGILAALHYLWLAQALLWPILYATLLALLLGWRAQDRIRRHRPWPAPPKVQPIRFFRK